MKLRILVVSQHYWPENFRVTDFCEGLVERGYEVDVLCGIPNYPKGEFFEGYSFFKNRKEIHNGVNIQRAFEIPRIGNTNIMIFLNYISYPVASCFHLPKLLLKKYDKIFIHQTSPVLMGISGIILGKVKRIKTITYVLDLWPENLYSVLEIKNKILRKIIYSISTWFYKHTDKLIAVSPEIEILLKERVNKQQGKITTVYQYCENIYEKNVYDKYVEKKFEGKFNILFTGNLTPAQSPDTIIATALLLNTNSYGEKIHFIIVGGGMSMPNFEESVHRNNLNHMFTFEGTKPIQDMPKYTNIADALLVTLAENIGLNLTIPSKVTSYIAAGKPIVASVNGATRYLIERIKCGLVSTPGNSDELYKNILNLYNMDSKMRYKMGKNARRFHFNYLERNKSIDKITLFMFD